MLDHAISWANVLSQTKSFRNKMQLLSFCYSLVFGCVSIRIDKAFYGEWTLVPLNFFYFNISKQISHIYGKMSLN